MKQIETEKYRKVWAIPEYGNYSPGEDMASAFLECVQPSLGSSIIDLGCGSGKGAVAIGDDYRRWLLDLTQDGLVEEAKSLPFIQKSLWEPFGDQWDYGYCCDVMEHIPPEYTMLVVKNIMDHCERAFFQICFLPDNFGQRIGEPLHLTVQTFEWWRDHLKEFGLIEARDLLQNGLFTLARPV